MLERMLQQHVSFFVLSDVNTVRETKGPGDFPESEKSRERFLFFSRNGFEIFLLYLFFIAFLYLSIKMEIKFFRPGKRSSSNICRHVRLVTTQVFAKMNSKSAIIILFQIGRHGKNCIWFISVYTSFWIPMFDNIFWH